MEKLRKLMTAVSDRLQLPGDVTAGMPKIELTGKGLLAVEPHRGLLEYGSERITVETSMGTLQIRGRALTIGAMNCRRLTVEGTILAAEWILPEHE